MPLQLKNKKIVDNCSFYRDKTKKKLKFSCKSVSFIFFK